MTDMTDNEKGEGEMGIPTFWDKVRDLIGSIGWAIFLWSTHQTNDQYWEMFEDELPEISDDVYRAMFGCSVVNGVRYFPYIMHRDKRAFLVDLREETNA